MSRSKTIIGSYAFLRNNIHEAARRIWDEHKDDMDADQLEALRQGYYAAARDLESIGLSFDIDNPADRQRAFETLLETDAAEILCAARDVVTAARAETLTDELLNALETACDAIEGAQ